MNTLNLTTSCLVKTYKGFLDYENAIDTKVDARARKLISPPLKVEKTKLTANETNKIGLTKIALKVTGAVLSLGAVFAQWPEDIYQGNIQPMQKIALIALTAWTAYHGIKDMTKKKWTRGIPKLLCSAALAGLSYLLLSSKPQFYHDFVRAQRANIKQMTHKRTVVGKWQELGRGVSKMTVVHPNLPGYVLKIPVRDNSYWASQKTIMKTSDIRLQYKYANEARDIIERAQLDQLVIPKSYLVETFSGPIVIEERLNVEHSMDWDRLIPFFGDKAKSKARNQLKYLQEKAKICDQMLFFSHNVAFLKDEKKIGIFDMDCKLT